MKIVKRIFFAAGVLLLLLIAAVVLAAVFVKPDQIKQMALERIHESSGYAVTAGPASLKLGFSGVGVRVDSLRLASPDSSQLVNVESVDVYAKLIPLLRRRVELSTVVIHRPVIDMAEPRSEPPPPGAAAPTEPSEASAPAMLLALDSWSVKDGVYRQEGSWGRVELGGLDLSGSFSWDPKAGGIGSAKGSMSGGLLEGRGGRFAIPSCDADADFRMAASGDSVEIPRARLSSGRVTAGLSGSYWATDTGWDGRLEVQADPVSWEDLRDLLPPDSLQAIQDLEIGGRFELTRLVLETVSHNKKTEMTGQLAFSEVSVRSPETPLGFSQGKGTVRFSPEAVAVADGEGRLGDDPVHFTVRAEGEELLDVRATLAGDISSANLTRLMPPDTPLRLERGVVGLDLSVAERLPLEPGQIPAVSGVIALGGLGGSFRDLPLKDVGGRVRLDGQSAEIESLQGSLGASDFLLRGRVTDLTAPVLAFTLDCGNLDLDELMETTKEAEEGSGAGEGEEAPEPVGLPLEGRVTVKKLTYRKMAAQGITARVELGEEGLVVDEIEATLSGGSAKGGLEAKPGAAPGEWAYEGHLDLDGIGVSPVLSSFTRVGNRVEGTTIARIEIEGTTAPGKDPLPSLTLAGDLKMRDGAFRNIQGLVALARGLKIKEAIQERWPFRNLSGAIAIRQGALVIDTLRIAQDQVDWTVGGTIGLDGRLGLWGTAFADPRHVTLPPEAELLAPYLEDDKGRIPIDFRLGGSMDAPNASLDWEAALLRATEKAKNEPREMLKDKIKDTLEDPNALDKLKKLFGKGG